MRIFPKRDIESVWRGWDLLKPIFIYLPLFILFMGAGVIVTLQFIVYGTHSDSQGLIDLLELVLGCMFGGYLAFLGFGAMYSKKCQALFLRQNVDPSKGYYTFRNFQLTGIMILFILILMFFYET